MLVKFSFRGILLWTLLSVVLPLAVLAHEGEEHDGVDPSRLPDPALEKDMVYIPPGPFVLGTDRKDTGRALEMGLPRPFYKDEGPEQRLLGKGFYIDRHEVTNRRYAAFIKAIDYFKPPHWEGGTYPEGQDERPITWVTWFDAANYCDWAGKRLPMEKEWERAARGKDGFEYPWGNEFDPARAHLSDKAGSKTELKNVGSFPDGASPEGVQDLVGSVWEWVQDDYGPYKGNTAENPEFGSGLKVLRGQSSSYIGHFPGELYNQVLKEFARSGYRQYSNPDVGASDVGFRCVRDTKPPGLEEGLRFASADSGGLGTMGGGGTPSGGAGDSAGTGNAAPDGASSGGSGSGSGGFSPFQPETHLPTQSGMLVLMVVAFIAGLFSFLSPCTLPILPAYFAVTAQTDRARMTLNSLAFFCGLAALFVVMGGSASYLGGLLRDYLNELTVAGGVVVTVFGLMTLAGKGFSGATFKSHPASTLAGFFLFGATFALGWTPCVGPVLSGILILAASDHTIFQGMTLLFFFALGLGLPLVVIAAFCSKLSKDGWFWRLLRGKGWTVQIAGRPVILHTTNLFSGFLLVGLGLALSLGYLTYFNNLIPLELQVWFNGIEEAFVHWIS